MAIEYFCCYHSYKTTLRRLSDEEVGRLIRALLEYSETGKEPEFDGRVLVAFDFIAADIDRAKQAYEEKCEKNRRNGAMGSPPNAPERPRTPPNAPQSKGKDKGKSKDKDNSPNGESTRAKRFTPPTLAEVQSYVAERHSPVDPQEFIDFYESKGWMVGKTPMKDWKAACRNAEKWERWVHKSGQNTESAGRTQTLNEKQMANPDPGAIEAVKRLRDLTGRMGEV